jgi:hypothetical protein
MKQTDFASPRMFISQRVPQFLQLNAVGFGCYSGIGREQFEVDDALKIPPN